MPETLVGVLLDRSILSTIVLLGILKAGGAYLPLDPTHPPQYIAGIVEDARPRFLVTNGAFRNLAPASVPSISFDDACSDVQALDSTNPSLMIDLDRAAYVIYTSGSTGKPKGVIQIHRSLTTRLMGRPLPDIMDGDICSLNSSLCFGISASRLFLPLALGLPVVIFSDSQLRDINHFLIALEDNRVTSIFLVPALLREVIRFGAGRPWRLRYLRAIAVGGGTLTTELVESVRKVLPSVTLVNLYGSTEVGTTATMKVIGTNETFTRRVPIGRPVANTRVYILSPCLKPVPIGAIGEICIEAEHLSRGYLEKPELTSERFISSPFTANPKTRLLRTGDCGSYLPTGEIEYRSRLDHQVKLRGFRVELGEIQAVLQRHQGVLESTLKAIEINNCMKLVAYIVRMPDSNLVDHELRLYLSSKVPSYMVPSAFVFLDKLPLTNAGKVDHASLRSPFMEHD